MTNPEVDDYLTRSDGLAARLRVARGEMAADAQICPFSLIRTMTVGSGISPDLLTRSIAGAALAGFAAQTAYRRWGVSPRPENFDHSS